ncbi:hypothetical protein V1290_000079 [Bradyrhizobium sp. AZCC 1578]
MIDPVLAAFVFWGLGVFTGYCIGWKRAQRT